MRLIDADALEKKLHELALDEWNQGTSTLWSNAYLECEDMVYDAQTVDAVEVVRCKDCKFYWKNSVMTNVPLCLASPREDAFCSDGERRED